MDIKVSSWNHKCQKITFIIESVEIYFNTLASISYYRIWAFVQNTCFSLLDNAEDILMMIQDLIHENQDLDEYELSTVLNKLADVINVCVITPPLGEVIINITSDILESKSNLLPFTNRCVFVTQQK